MITDSSYANFRHYIFYNDMYNRFNARRWQTFFKNMKADKIISNVRFSESCDLITDYLNAQKTLVLSNEKKLACHKELNPFLISSDQEATVESMIINKTHIVALKDSGTHYTIYNDKLCSNYKLPSFLSNYHLNTLKIDKLTPEQFCRQWIVSYFNQ